MDISPAKLSDLPQILAMIKALTAFHDDEATVTLRRLEEVLFTSGLSAAFMAKVGAVAIGYAGLNFTTELHSGTPRIDIHHLYVAENYRGQGVGRALIAAANQFAKAQGARGMTIGTASTNTSAQETYRAMGLEEITDTGPRFWIPIA